MSFSTESQGQRSKEFIYGKVTTKSNEQYIGFIRWGKEEFLWHDVFNSAKLTNKRVHSNKNKPSSLWDNFDWNLSSIWEDKYRQTSHLFSCLFGDIKSLYPRSSEKVDLELKNGTVIKLEGGSNDVGTTLRVYDFELGLVKIKWNKISKVEFSDAPDTNETNFGQPLYGRVKTYRKGSFEGYIKWDLDERTTEDILDGDDGDQQVAFKNIKSITKDGEGVSVILHSGRQVYLKGSNDVNSQNRGIAIYQSGVGNIQVNWKEFKHLELMENDEPGLDYKSFGNPVGLKAEIKTYDDHVYSGLMVYDVDEKWEIEFIDGNDDKVEYQIPLRFIKRIVPKNKTYSQLYLRNGEVLLLGDGQDVSYKNDGVLLFVKANKEPKLIEWEDIVEIKIK